MPTSGHKTSLDFAALVARRIWTADDKRRLVAEMSVSGANVSEISRRHRIANSLLYRWRREAEAVGEHVTTKQLRSNTEPSVAPVFVPIGITVPPQKRLPTPRIAAPRTCAGVGANAKSVGTMDIVLANGRFVRVGPDVDTKALVRIVAALERAE